MAFISNKEREKLVKKANSGTGFRKVFIFVTLICAVALALFGALSCMADVGWIKVDELTFFNKETGEFTIYGYIYFVISLFVLVGGIISVIFSFSFRSAKKVSQINAKLDSSALSGVKIKHDDKVVNVIKSRKVVNKKYAKKK